MMNIMNNGYQWGTNFAYIGEYSFPNNLDKEEVHLPPNTTLQAPPNDVPKGEEAFWTGSNWAIRAKSLVI